MTNVSKHELTQKEAHALLKQFAQLFYQRSAQTLHTLFTEVLTPAEQTMLIKRVAIIIMIHNGASTFEIARSLKVSATTVAAHNVRYQEGAYETIIKTVCGNSFDTEKFWRVVDKVFRVGLPPMAGPGRWGNLSSVRGTRSKSR
jgi:Trp operon repressor